MVLFEEIKGALYLLKESNALPQESYIFFPKWCLLLGKEVFEIIISFRLLKEQENDLLHLHSRIVEDLASHCHQDHVVTGDLFIVLKDVFKWDITDYQVCAQHSQSQFGLLMNALKLLQIGFLLLLEQPHDIVTLHFVIDVLILRAIRLYKLNRSLTSNFRVLPLGLHDALVQESLHWHLTCFRIACLGQGSNCCSDRVVFYADTGFEPADKGG